MTEAVVAVEPSQNSEEQAATAAIEAPKIVRSTSWKSPANWCARPEMPGWHSPARTGYSTLRACSLPWEPGLLMRGALSC